MKTSIIKYFIVFLVYLVGFLAWLSVERAINIPESSTWLVPAIWFSAFFILLSLGVVLLRDSVQRWMLAGSFFLSWLFSFSLGQFVFAAASFLLALWALGKIAKDLELNKKIDVIKSARTGKSILILALALAISTQYYFSVRNTDKAMIIPKFKSGFIAEKILPELYPNLKNTEGDLTVDEFILEMSKKNSKEITSEKDLGMYEKEAEKILQNNEKMILQEGRLNLSKMAGKEITGQEKMADVFSDMINNRISEYLSKGMDQGNALLVSRIAALVLFLTIWSLSAFLSPVVSVFVFVIFFILKKSGLIKISTVMAEVEVLE